MLKKGLNIFKDKNIFFIIILKKSYFIKFALILLFLLIIIKFNKNINIKIALCTMGKQENLYVKEFISYYIKLGIDNFFIYDDNDENSERISDMIDIQYKNIVEVYEAKKLKFVNQSLAFTDCYDKNKNKFDWILMVDMDEFLYIKKDTLKNYLLNPVFNKCDFIKINWVLPSDNDQLFYENKSLFERFKGPYKKSRFIKSIIRGNISNLKYWVHSPYISPYRNVSCNNIGKKINNDIINFEHIDNINIRKSFIIHFHYKSTEEFIQKIKRGYSNWHGKELLNVLKYKIYCYLKDNKMAKDKIEYLEKELNINLSEYKGNK
jgi:hypothetical protein